MMADKLRPASRCRRSGFTLMEVLLVSVLIAGIGIAVFTCLSNGLKLWSRSQRIILEEDAALFLDRFASDLRNAFIFSTLTLVGDSSRIAFPTIVWTPADRASSRSHEGSVDQIGMVRYSFDSSRHCIAREQADYSQSTNGDFGPARVMVEGIAEIRFRYYYRGNKEAYLSAKDDKSLPAGVEVELHFQTEGPAKIWKRYFPIPAGI